ncbi:3-phenylpropionate/cinnamic acid dioxygenase ferredoxin--NAD(+) reductase subunit [Kerstersia similis]|uniref:3-phenylpropionate/cinnamic acid dioxygenase ferredoxin--NAD(+) reductase subunit n=1 Tax=Kerstersia similis TaxID=206505 RepID=UPI0039EEE977
MSDKGIIIIGAGQAGAMTAAQLRQLGFTGRVTLLGDETHAPYERPPLSKDMLLQPAQTRCAIHPDDFYRQHDIQLRLGVAAVGLDTQARTVTLADGESLDYDKLVLATGARARRLPMLDALGEGVYTLRTLEDAAALQPALQAGHRLILVGAGVIGLELASTAVDLGVQVAVVEPAELPMMRATPRLLAEFLCAVHRERGVELHLRCSVVAAARTAEGLALTLSDGSCLTGQTVVYGIGVEPNVELAQAAGLAVDNGILTDRQCRTSDPDVYAVGDVAARQTAAGLPPVRRETWENANWQAELAARDMLGLALPPQDIVPWYWTDQCGLNIQLAGDMGAARWIVRGALGAGPCMLLGLSGDELVAAITVNQGRDMRSAKELIARRACIEPAVLADTQQSLRNLSRALPA